MTSDEGEEKNDQLKCPYHSSMNAAAAAADWSMWWTTAVGSAAVVAAAAKVSMHEPFS